MMRIFALATLAGVWAADPSDWVKNPIKKYTINLDLPPEQRYTELMKDHKTYYMIMVQALKVMFRSNEAKQFINATVLPEEYRRELQGIADATGATYDQVLMGEMFYELNAISKNPIEGWGDIAARACTGIVAQNSNGTVMHARNQDYPPPFSPLQYDGTYMKDGKVLFEATNFAGIVGIGGTCMVPGKFSAECNARHDNHVTLAQYLERTSAGKAHFPMLLRDACANSGNFESAVKYLSKTPMISTGYYTVAGAAPGEGAIVTRNASGTDTDVRRLSAGWPEGGSKPWYLVQTNFDYWDHSVHPAPLAPKLFGDDKRFEMGVKLMAAIGPDNVNLERLWEVMTDNGNTSRQRWGIFNAATIHTELVVPATGEYHTYLRHSVIKEVLV